MLILCVQIDCIRHWKYHSSITVLIRGSAFPGLFKAKLRVFATTLVNGLQKKAESKKETTCYELQKGKRNQRHCLYCALFVSEHLALLRDLSGFFLFINITTT